MPDAIIGLFVLAAIVGGVILWQKFTSALGNKATQSILRPKDHKAGQELVSKKHEFVVSASVPDVKKAILEQVSALPNEPAVRPALYLAQSSDSLIVYQYGAKVQTVFRMLVHMQAAEAGTRGSFEIVNWMLASGIVARQHEMKQLNADIETALRKVDPKATLRVAG